MQKTSKWVPITAIFLILLLVGVLLFSTPMQAADTTPQNTDSVTTPPTTQTTPPTSSSQTAPSDNTSSTTQPASETPSPNISLLETYPLYDNTGTLVAKVSLNEYLCGALLSCISFTYAPAALEAQAIALRTETYSRLLAGGAISTETYGYTDYNALLAVWGEEFARTIWARAEAAVQATDGQILLSEGALYAFATPGEQGVLLSQTDIGKRAATATVGQLLAIYYPSASLLREL